MYITVTIWTYTKIQVRQDLPEWDNYVSWGASEKENSWCHLVMQKKNTA
jgi:hypothetical protein